MRVARLKEAYPTAKVELWCEDEHRLQRCAVLLTHCIFLAWYRFGGRFDILCSSFEA
jgi:hypothetical protein